MTKYHYKQFNDELDHLSEAVKARKPDEIVTVMTTQPENKIWADVLKKTLYEGEYDNSASRAILLYNIAETSDDTSETSAKASVEQVFSTIKVNSGGIKAISRLGNLNPSNARPRPIEIQLTTFLTSKWWCQMSNI